LKTILFISNRCGAAGVEAQLQLLVGKLAGSYRIGVLLARHGDNSEMYKSLCRNAFVFVGGQFLSKSFREFARQVDEVWVMSSYPLMLYHIIQHWLPRARLALAVYHPDEYCWPARSPLAIRKLIFTTWRNLPPTNVYFMNEACRVRHAEVFGDRFLESPILPLFISLKSTVVPRSLSRLKKIVSIGRITGFKTYNFEMLPIIAKLIHEYPIEYHIYGDGEKLPQLRVKVNEMKLDRVVKLHGAISYEDRLLPYMDAFVFVGMGLSLVEASACGVPSIVAIENDVSSSCYGLFSDMTNLNVGELDSNVQSDSIAATLLDLLKLNEDEYAELCNKHRRKGKCFSDEFLQKSVKEFLRGSQPSKVSAHPVIAVISLFQIVVFKLLERIGFSTYHSGRYGKGV